MTLPGRIEAEQRCDTLETYAASRGKEQTMDETSLVGVWTLVSYVITDEKGEVVYIPFGEDPSGLLIYTDSGYMSAQLASTNRPHFIQEQLLAASDREKAQAADTYIGYSGTYERQEDQVIHHVAVSFFPNWTGGEQIRVVD